MATAQTPATDETHCVLCCYDLEFTVCGSCDHPICVKCCVKLRLLRKEYDCPVCRAQLKEVIVSKGYKTWAEKSRRHHHRQRVGGPGIHYETPECRAKVDELLEHRCPECHECFQTFFNVKDHVRKVHSLYYCDICLKHLKIFTHERKCYSRENLVRHRKEGDADDRSHRGHPLCLFCDDRYLDNDELLLHLRKNHFWCHLCEKDGCQDYYPNYKELRRHFKVSHFLCEEGECLHEKLTSVFRSKIDYQAHKAQKHSDKLSKAEARQIRQLDVDIKFHPRQRSYPNSDVSDRDYSFPDQGNMHYGGRRPGSRDGRSGLSGFRGPHSDFTEFGESEGNQGNYRGQEKGSRQGSNDWKNVTGLRQSSDVNLERPKQKVPREANRDIARSTKDDVGTKRKTKRVSEENVNGRKSRDALEAQNRRQKLKDAKESQVNEESMSGSSRGQVERNSRSAKDFTKSTTRRESNENSRDRPGNSIKSLANYKEGKSTHVQNETNVNPAVEGKFLELPLNDEARTTSLTLRPGYDSEFPSLANEFPQNSSNVKPPPGFAPYATSVELERNTGGLGNVKPTASIVGVGDFPTTTTNTEKRADHVETAGKKPRTKSTAMSVSSGRTYDSEFPTLASVTNGADTVSNFRNPPGLAPPANKQSLRPPPGLGWSVPLHFVPRTSASSIGDRNQKLIHDIRRILNMRGESFEKFQEKSGCFRKGLSSPELYYRECCDLLGEENVRKVFREMIDLLPDEGKQQQLLRVYNDAKIRTKEEASLRFVEAGKSFVQNQNEPSVQDMDFPALPKASGKKAKKTGKVASAWTRSR